ncbi:hypothetical protein FDUTEX481_00702 [Tolypothrix sp. PCC 7601]|nr:hypothetical protein FDUTEX481_00702 [Tolypothrix sp. PCC 7601]
MAKIKGSTIQVKAISPKKSEVVVIDDLLIQSDTIILLITKNLFISKLNLNYLDFFLPLGIFKFKKNDYKDCELICLTSGIKNKIAFSTSFPLFASKL